MTDSKPRSRLLSWLSTDRLLVAALIASVFSFALKAADDLQPGLPQSAIQATKQIPFFNHMTLCGYVFLIAVVGGKPVEKWAALWPRLCIAVIVFATVGAGLTQWYFPNY